MNTDPAFDRQPREVLFRHLRPQAVVPKVCAEMRLNAAGCLSSMARHPAALCTQWQSDGKATAHVSIDSFSHIGRGIEHFFTQLWIHREKYAEECKAFALKLWAHQAVRYSVYAVLAVIVAVIVAVIAIKGCTFCMSIMCSMCSMCCNCLLCCPRIFLHCCGFTAKGVRAASFASGWQSSIGNVPSGSTFSSLQSFGATGYVRV